MPKYFFHVVNSRFIPDTEGTECATAEEVRTQAVKAAGDMLRDMGLEIWTTNRWYMFVTDETNRTLLELAFDAEDLTGELGGGKS